jgi:hypothetical protein
LVDLEILDGVALRQTEDLLLGHGDIDVKAPQDEQGEGR